MPTCALCESTQEVGDACEVCGHPFPAGEALPVRIPRLAELEPTLHDGADTGPVARLAELEPTSEVTSGGPVDAAGGVEGFSPTAAEPVTVVVEPLDVERTGQEQVLDEVAEPRAVRCRYCLTPADPGQRLCARCGMRLPLERPPPAAAAAAGHPCSECGVSFPGTQCPACGARRS